MKGIFKRSGRNGNKFPYTLPLRVLDAKKDIDMEKPLNFLAACDASGGNTGSPLVNTSGEFTGILFDGTKQSLPSRFLYEDSQARVIMVHGRGILEMLARVYKTHSLIEELVGK